MSKWAYFGLVVLLCFRLSAQSGKPTSQSEKSVAAAVPGAIVIDVLEGGRPEHYWQYQVRPSTGEIRVVLHREFKDTSNEEIPRAFQKPAGSIGGCEQRPQPEAVSSDGRFVAHCSKSSSGRDELIVTDTRNSSSFVRWVPKEWRGIQGFAWGPNSQFIAILNYSEYYGKAPSELVSGISGHPVPHDTEYLNVIDASSGAEAEYNLRKNVKYSFSRILRWSE